MSDEQSVTVDVRPQLVGWTPGPVTTSTAFMCARCGLPKSRLGSKLERVRGLRTWVCATCAPRARK